MTSKLANTRLDATIVGTGDLETGFAGEMNLASSVIASSFVGIRDSLAVLSVVNVIPERRSNGATTTYGPTLNIPLHTARRKLPTTLSGYPSSCKNPAGHIRAGRTHTRHYIRCRAARKHSQQGFVLMDVA